MTAGVGLSCSVVIPTKNGGTLFGTVLQALQRQSCWAQTELIVVDSGSTDDTVALARKYGAKVHEIAPHTFNHGATRDHGIALSSSELVVLMVQDAVPHDEHLLRELIGAFDDARVAGAYARQLPQSSADVLTQRNLNGWLTGRTIGEVRALDSLATYARMSAQEKYFFCNFDNVCSALRKSVWKDIPFGTINFGEDIDWSERALKAGHAIAYQASAVVVHSHDRPLSYEYKRTYVCHRKLYRQFGLHTVPSWRSALGPWLWTTLADIGYVWRSRAALAEKLRLTWKVPALNWLGMLGQYRGARDEQQGLLKVVKDV